MVQNNWINDVNFQNYIENVLLVYIGIYRTFCDFCRTTLTEFTYKYTLILANKLQLKKTTRKKTSDFKSNKNEN